MSNNVDDLRSALEFLHGIPGQLVETDVEVDPEAELCGVYRHVGAGGTVPRPTQEGPAMVFNNIKGHPDARVAIGLLASRDSVAKLLDADPKRLGFMLNEAVLNPVPPVDVPEEEAVCREVVQDIGSRRVYTQLDVQRLTALKFVHEGLLGHDLSGAGLDNMKLLFR